MRWTVISCFIALFSLAACQYGPVSSTGGVGDLRVMVEASTNCTNRGDIVTLRASVVNEGPETFAVELKDRPVLNLCIGDYPGYSKCWADGRALTSDLTRLQLKQGESKAIEMKWVAELAGSYAVAVRFIDRPNATEDPIHAGVTVGVAPDCPGNR